MQITTNYCMPNSQQFKKTNFKAANKLITEQAKHLTKTVALGGIVGSSMMQINKTAENDTQKDSAGSLEMENLPIPKKNKYEFKKLDFNTDIYDLIYEAKGTEARLFAEGEKQLYSIIEKLPKGAKTTEPIVISVGVNNLGIMIDKTDPTKTIVTVRNWLGNKESFDKPARKEEVFTFVLDEEGVMIDGKVYWSDYFQRHDKTEYSYSFKRQEDGQGSIVYRQDHYNNRYSYRTMAKPQATRTETYLPSRDNPNAWIYSNEEEPIVSREMWDITNSRRITTPDTAIEYKEGKPTLLNMFVNFARPDVKLETTKRKPVEQKAEEPKLKGRTVSEWKDYSEYANNRNPRFNQKEIDLINEAKTTEAELFAKAKEELPQLIEQVSEGKKMFMPKTMKIGNNNIGIIVDKTTKGKTDVIIKNWQGKKDSWLKKAEVESQLMLQLDENGNVLLANVRWNDYFEENDIIRNYYTFKVDENGYRTIKSEKRYYLDRYRYRNSNKEPFWKKKETFVDSKAGKDGWICIEHEGAVPMENFLEENSENPGIMNMFLDFSKDKNKPKSEPPKTEVVTENPAVETKNTANAAKNFNSASVRKPIGRKISSEKASAVLEQVKGNVKEKLKQYIGIEVYKNAVVSFKDSPEAFDRYISYQTEKFLQNTKNVLPETKEFIKNSIKEIVLERTKDIDVKDRIAKDGIKAVEAQLNIEFADITENKAKNPKLRIKDLFTDEDILKVFVKEGMNIGEIASLISTDANTASKILKTHDFNIDGRRKRTTEPKTEENPAAKPKNTEQKQATETGIKLSAKPNTEIVEPQKKFDASLYLSKTDSELQTEVMELSNIPEMKNNTVFEEVCDFIFEQSNYTPEQKILIGEFIEMVKSTKEGVSLISDVKKSIVIDKINKWKEDVKREETKNQQIFDSTQKKLDSLAQKFNKHQMQDVYHICAQYLSADIKNTDAHTNATKILGIYRQNDGNLKKTAEAILDWDFGKDAEIREEAAIYATNKEGKVDEAKVDEYIHFTRIMFSPDTTTPIGKFAEIFGKAKNLPASLCVKNLVKIDNMLKDSTKKYQEIVDELNKEIEKRNKEIEKENIRIEERNKKLKRKGLQPIELLKKEPMKEKTDEVHPEMIFPELYEEYRADNNLNNTLLEMYFNEMYIDVDSKALTKDSTGKNSAKKQVSYITSDAKKALVSKNKFPSCLPLLYKYETALRMFAATDGQLGVKTDLGKNNKKRKYTIEVKILESDYRFYSSQNNFVFDIWGPGIH